MTVWVIGWSVEGEEVEDPIPESFHCYSLRREAGIEVNRSLKGYPDAGAIAEIETSQFFDSCLVKPLKVF